MGHYRNIIASVGIALCLAGCSKQSGGGRDQAPATLKKLGVVELSDHQANRHDLGAGRICVITPVVLSDGRLDLEVVIEFTDAAGNVRRFTKPHVIASNGHTVTVTAGDIGLEFTPQLKSP